MWEVSYCLSSPPTFIHLTHQSPQTQRFQSARPSFFPLCLKTVCQKQFNLKLWVISLEYCTPHHVTAPRLKFMLVFQPREVSGKTFISKQKRNQILTTLQLHCRNTASFYSLLIQVCHTACGQDVFLQTEKKQQKTITNPYFCGISFERDAICPSNTWARLQLHDLNEYLFFYPKKSSCSKAATDQHLKASISSMLMVTWDTRRLVS